jgi:8-oxo-dGTP pyrophosphatase MutT (NUDIX family)
MEKKIAVVALIYQEEILNSKILAVSRKNNHSDFGLPGGKLEASDETMFHGLIREVMEETGVRIEKAEPIFTREDNEYVAIVFLVTKWTKEDVSLNPSETGRVKWADFEDLKKGSFGNYNSKLENHLKLLKDIF